MMVANFSDEHILIPKATTLGVAEEISETLIAPIPDEDEISETAFNVSKTVENRFAGNKKIRNYLNGKLAHLSRDERASIEPVLVRFASVFHVDETNYFKSTNVVEHGIETADARPIRRAPYRVPFALKEEMGDQVQNMLKKGFNSVTEKVYIGHGTRSSAYLLLPRYVYVSVISNNEVMGYFVYAY
jgi:hypothetical protein